MHPKQRMIFIHGLEGSSQGIKARLLRSLFPDILTPDFVGTLKQRMQQLYNIVGDQPGWKMIGSSFGGLMATIFACEQPKQVERLILLAPALLWPEFDSQSQAPISVPTVIYHGRQDEVVPLEATRKVAERLFLRLDFCPVDDDHGLYKTTHELNWKDLLEGSWAE